MAPIDTQEVQLQRQEVEQWRAGLDALHARIAGRFARAEVRERVRRYLAGVLDRVERKNGWQIEVAPVPWRDNHPVIRRGPVRSRYLLSVSLWASQGRRAGSAAGARSASASSTTTSCSSSSAMAAPRPLSCQASERSSQ